MKAEQGNRYLIQHIQEKIRNSPGQSISFYEYMNCCLYHEPFGYYQNDRVKIGRDGDFYTSSHVGTLMGEMLSKSFAAVFRTRPADAPLAIVEWGAGTGRLAGHLLTRLMNEAPDCYERLTYTLIDASAYHRARQSETLAGHADRLRFMDEAEWLAEAPVPGTIVLANELLDAFPVYRLVCREGRWYEVRVGWDEHDRRFAEKLVHLEPDDELRAEALRQGIMLREGQYAELNVDAPRWIRRIGANLPQGMIVVIDYGAAAEELYAAHRMRGTLLCYRRHQAHDNPYIHIGEQDMTAHVNFTACRQAGKEAGFGEITLQTQREFLVQAGILDELREHASTDPFSPVSKRNRAIRQLLLSDSMSELFKVLTLRRT